VLHPHHGRQAVLPGDHRAMGHQAPHLRHQAFDGDEQGRPAGVGESGQSRRYAPAMPSPSDVSTRGGVSA
jgi:hypothetical protein